MNKEIIVLLVVGVLAILAAAFTLLAAYKRDLHFIYVHTKTGNKYRIVANAHNKMRRPDTGEWLEAITYVNEEGEQFTRWRDDFLISFQRLNEWEEEHKS